MTTAIDIALCVDATGGMAPWFELLKSNVSRFHRDFVQLVACQGKRLDRVRIRVILFRDLHEDQKEAITQSPFFTLPEHNLGLEAFLASTQAHGGGDEPESGLEALAIAMRSPWSQWGDRKRHIIVLFTDASAHRLEDASARRPVGYPRGLPRSWAQLTEEWDKMSASKRLLLWAPDLYPWSRMSDWEDVYRIVARPGHGLIELDYRSVVETIAACA